MNFCRANPTGSRERETGKSQGEAPSPCSPYPSTRITITIITQTMIPARKRSSTMKIRLATMAMTRPLREEGTHVSPPSHRGTERERDGSDVAARASMMEIVGKLGREW